MATFAYPARVQGCSNPRGDALEPLPCLCWLVRWSFLLLDSSKTASTSSVIVRRRCTWSTSCSRWRAIGPPRRPGAHAGQDPQLELQRAIDADRSGSTRPGTCCSVRGRQRRTWPTSTSRPRAVERLPWWTSCSAGAANPQAAHTGDSGIADGFHLSH